MFCYRCYLSKQQDVNLKHTVYFSFALKIQDYTVKHMEAHKTNQLTTKRKK